MSIHIQIIVILTLLIFTIIANQCTPNHSNHVNYQILTVQNNILNIQFNIVKHSLPFFLRNTLQRNFIKSVQINMGYRFNKKVSSQLPPNGISAIIRKPNIRQGRLSQQFMFLLNGVFLISTNNQFIIDLEGNVTFINNPNDKLCSQNVDLIVKTFLPCHSYSGLAQLIDSKILFTANYVGLKITWTEVSINIQFYIQLTNHNNNIVRTKVQRKCQSFSQSQLYDQNGIAIKSGVIRDKLKYSPEKNLSDHIQSRWVQGKWYSYAQPKLLTHKFIYNYQRFGYVTKIIFTEMFPPGFQIQSIKIDSNLSPNVHHTTQITTLKSKYIIVRASVWLNQSINHQHWYELKVCYKSYMLGFEDYETIGGGGEQFMRIPIILQTLNNTIYIPSAQVSDKLLQPDFSIPFHVITFTMAILGYVWVALWRIYFKYLEFVVRKKQRSECQKQQ